MGRIQDRRASGLRECANWALADGNMPMSEAELEELFLAADLTGAVHTVHTTEGFRATGVCRPVQSCDGWPVRMGLQALAAAGMW